MKKILLIALLSIMILSGCSKETKKEENKITKNNGMLSYTIDGEKTDIKPTKEDGYIVNKIICDNGSDMMWDNDNWEVELTKVNSKDRCKVDFTKDTSTPGYRVSVTSNITSALDSLSKTTTKNGTVKIYSKSTIKTVTGCNGVIEDNKVIVKNITSNQTCNIEVEDKTLAGVIKNAYTPQPGRTDFSAIDNGTPGLYVGTDNQGTTYYFSGDGTNMNNWVSFAGKIWRIIRINGNGSVRLLYAGNGTNITDIGITAYNSNYNHPAYVGWKYTLGGTLDKDRGNSTKSEIYTKLENWYDTNIVKADLAKYISFVSYCNDRNIGSGTYAIDSGNLEFAAYTRVAVTRETPIFTCHWSDEFYNTFGLITADEIVASGGLLGEPNIKAYYNLGTNGKNILNNGRWWTMTPMGYGGIAAVFTVGSGNFAPSVLSSEEVNGVAYIRPVISLKSEVIITGGDGSGASPYTITLP